MAQYTVYFTTPDGREEVAIYGGYDHAQVAELFQKDFGIAFDYIVEQAV